MVDIKQEECCCWCNMLSHYLQRQYPKGTWSLVPSPNAPLQMHLPATMPGKDGSGVWTSVLSWKS